jgi:hypothetical protein
LGFIEEIGMGGVENQDGEPGLASEEERGNVSLGSVVPIRLVSRGTEHTNDVPAIWAKVRDNRGRYLTRALFVETIHTTSPYTPTYTLGEWDMTGYPSARKIYLESNDPTEYTAAFSLLGSLEHWQHLCGTTWFAPIVEQWRDEMAVKLRSEATKKVIELTNAYESSSVLAAAKKLLDVLEPSARNATRRNKTRSEQLLDGTDSNPVGRPRKPPVLNEVSTDDTDADFARILDLG